MCKSYRNPKTPATKRKFKIIKKNQSPVQKSDPKQISTKGAVKSVAKLESPKTSKHSSDILNEREPSLWSCTTKNEVGKLFRRWDKTLKKFALKAVKGKKSKMSDEMLSSLEALLKLPGATSEPLLIDPGIVKSARKQLSESIASLRQDTPNFEIGFVTIIDGAFETSHHRTEIDLFGIKSVSRRILSKMARDYFGIVELAFFNSHKHPTGGRLISPHTHALIWGPQVVSKAREVADSLQKTLKPNFTGAIPIVVEPVNCDAVNLWRIAAYLLKSPHQCKTFYPGKDGINGNIHASRKGDRNIRYLRLTELRSMLSFDQVTFASGEGLRMRSGIVQSLRILAKEQARKSGRPLHPDEIPSFWNDLKIATKTTRLNMPIIKTRK